MKLYQFPFAPNAAKVRLYLAEKVELGCEIPVEEVLVNLVEGEHKSEAHLARNPHGTVPNLELDDGSFTDRVARDHRVSRGSPPDALDVGRLSGERGLRTTDRADRGPRCPDQRGA